MGTMQQEWEKNKKNNFVTLSNASTAAKPKPSGANVVSGKSANLGAGKATSGANVVSAASADLGGGKAPTAKNAYQELLGSQGTKATSPVSVFKAPAVKTAKAASFAADPNIKAVGSDIATEAYKQRLAAQQAAQSETVEEEKKETTAGAAGTGSNAGTQASFAMQPVDNLYSREKALNLLAKYGMTEADLRGVPLEAMYEGNNRYILPYLLNKPDNYTIMSDGKLITVGELKSRLTNGMYVPGNTAAQPATYGASAAQTAAAEPEVDPMDDSLLQDILDAQEAQYDAQLQMLRNQRGVLDQQYDANAADLYAMYRRSGLMMPEMLAGTATGIADSFALQNDLNFQNNLADNELARVAAQNELSAQANQIQADADLQAAQTAADWAKMMYQRQASQNNGNEDEGYSTSEILKMQAQGLIDDATAQQMLGLSSSVKKLTAADYINSNYGRTDFANMTADKIRADLKYLLDNGLMDTAEYNLAMTYYKLA